MDLGLAAASRFADTAIAMSPLLYFAIQARDKLRPVSWFSETKWGFPKIGVPPNHPFKII